MSSFTKLHKYIQPWDLIQRALGYLPMFILKVNHAFLFYLHLLKASHPSSGPAPPLISSVSPSLTSLTPVPVCFTRVWYCQFPVSRLWAFFNFRIFPWDCQSTVELLTATHSSTTACEVLPFLLLQTYGLLKLKVNMLIFFTSSSKQALSNVGVMRQSYHRFYTISLLNKL